MKNKLKKQKRNITLKITAVLLIVWLFVSVVFSVAVIALETEKTVKAEQDKFYTLARSIESNGADTADLYIETLKEPYKYASDTEKPEITCGADGYLDNSLQIVILTDNKDGTYSEMINTDKEISIYGYGYLNNKEDKNLISGSISYEGFIQSLTQEQLDAISKYLYTKKDKDGNYYELICKELYYNEADSSIIPKTVEIVLTNENNTWYAQDEVIETYNLNTVSADNLPLYTSAYDCRNVISGQFVLGTFRSDNLIDSYAGEDGYTYLDEARTRVAPFTYLYQNCAIAHIREFEYDDMLYLDSDGYYYTVYQSAEPILVINYAKKFCVLDTCKSTLILGISTLFFFFLIIGIIITTMMYKVIKTQLIEEDKRKEVTNALAHDIKTPLFIISGYAQNLKENINTDKREHYCERILERTDEVNSLVHKMLDFSKLGETEQKLNLEAVDVNELVSSTIEDYRNLPDSKSIKFDAKKDCQINADKDLLKRAVSYLLDNAVRYSLDNTDIKISLTDNSLSISNTCENISEQDLKHLTEPYYRVEKNRESKGNGLGLSIVKSIVELHSFNLLIELKDNIITFTVKF